MNGIWIQILAWGMFGTFSGLHRKMSEHWVCKMIKLNQISGNVCPPDASAGSMLVYSVCGFCPWGTLENVVGLVHQFIYRTYIRKWLISCTQVYSTL